MAKKEAPVALSQAEHMSLMAVRAWVAAPSSDEDTQAHHNILSGIFLHAGNQISANAFDRFMVLLASESDMKIDVRCRTCATISDDEMLLLMAFRTAQHTDLGALETILSKWLPDLIALRACPLLVECFAVWKKSGYLFPNCMHCTEFVVQGLHASQKAPRPSRMLH